MKKTLFTSLLCIAAVAMFAQKPAVTSIGIAGRALASQVNFNVSEPLTPLGSGVFYWEGNLNYINPNSSSGSQGFKFTVNWQAVEGSADWNGKWCLMAMNSDNEEVSEGTTYIARYQNGTANDWKWRLKNGEDGFYRITVDASDVDNVTFTLDKDPEPLVPPTVPGVFLHFDGDEPNVATELQTTADVNVFTLTGRFIQPNKLFNIQINKGQPTWLNASVAANIPFWTEQTLTASETDGDKFTFANLEGYYILTVDTASKTVKIAPPAIEKIYISGRCPANVGGYGNSVERLDELVNEGDGVFSWTGLLTDIKPDGSTGADFKFTLNEKYNPWWYTLTAENANTVLADGQSYPMRPTGDIAANFSDTKWKLANSAEDGAYKLTIDIKTLTMSVEKLTEAEGVFAGGTALPLNADAYVVRDPSFRLLPIGDGKFRQKILLAENGTLNFFVNKINRTYLLANTENEQITDLCQSHFLAVSATEGEGFVSTLPTGYYDIEVDTVAKNVKIIGEEECISTYVPETEMSGAKIFVVNGSIVAEFDGSKLVELYSVTGQMLYRGVANGNFRRATPAGIYLLSIDSKKVKVLVK